MMLKNVCIRAVAFVGVGIASAFALPLTCAAAAPSVVSHVIPSPGNASVDLAWTNPSSSNFTGTMVRYSETAFPTSITDGTLATDVAGAPSSTSTATVSGLTNGTTYYFSLFAHNAALEYSAAVSAEQLVMDEVFSDDFESLAVGSVSGQNGWSVLGDTWSVVDTLGEQTVRSTAANLAFHVARIVNGGEVQAYTDQMVRVDWKGSTTATPGQAFLRAQSGSADAGGYFLWQSGGSLRVSYKTTSGSSSTQLASGSFSPAANTWYTYEFSVVNGADGLPVLTGYAWERGSAKPSTPTVQVTDTVNRFPQGVFSLGKASTTVAEYDNVAFYGRMGILRAGVVSGSEEQTLTWTHPTLADYAGTMVRYSTTDYPATTTDGTLVDTVAGSSGGTSSLVHSGLTNGTEYYYTLFPYDTVGNFGTPLRIAHTVYPNVFEESFDTLALGAVAGQGGWSTYAGAWEVEDVSSARVMTAAGTPTYPTNKVTNGNAETTDQMLSVRFMSDAATHGAGLVWLRYQTDGSGYLVWHNGNVWSAGYYDASIPRLTTVATAAATATPAMEADAWFHEEVSVVNVGGLPVIRLYVWRDGAEKPLTPSLEMTDTVDRFVQGTFALGRNTGSGSVHYDDVAFFGTAPAVTITSPAASVAAEPLVATRSIVDEDGVMTIPYIQSSTTLDVRASSGQIASGGGIEFVLDEGRSTEQRATDLSVPYTASFSGLAKGTYTLDAYGLEADGVTRIADAAFHDSRTDIAIGDIFAVIGDSITEGYLGTMDAGIVEDWLDADAGTLSRDHRNFPQYGTSSGTYAEGYYSDLNDQLSTYLGYPVFFMNEGRGGIRAGNYASTVMTEEWSDRVSALSPNRWIVALGNNDANQNTSAATYQADMEAILSTLQSDYGATVDQIFVPYPLYDFRTSSDGTPTADVLTAYLPVIDTLRSSLGVQAGPDLYHVFENYQATDYDDLVHPNAVGYERMADLWALSLMQPSAEASVSGRRITLAWEDLSAAVPTVAGYRVRYGTDPAHVDTTLTLGSVTTTTFTTLAWDTTYYFDVVAFDNDAYDVSYSRTDDVFSATTATGSSEVSVTPFVGLVTETGGSGTFTVVLTDQPGAGVSIPVTVTDPTEGAVSHASLVFTSGNWNVAQTIRVTGVPDGIVDGTVTYTVVLGAAVSADPEYTGVDATDVVVATVDSDVAVRAERGGEISTAPHVRTLHMLTPTFGSRVRDGAPLTTTWSSSGVIAYVDFEYSADGGRTWKTVATRVPNTGTTTLTLPSGTTATAYVRVHVSGHPVSYLSATSMRFAVVRGGGTFFAPLR